MRLHLFGSANSGTRLIVAILVVMAFAINLFQAGAAKAQPSQPPAIDLMLLIDNSCSMFKPNTPDCPSNTVATDPGSLRIKGAELFVARLGFGQLQAKDRIGVISFGGDHEIVYPLTPISDFVRNDLAVKVEDPKPRGATQVIHALESAYSELGKSSNLGNRPAIVFMTDGVPDPEAGQSFPDIAGVVNQHRDVPIYVLLLQNQSDPTGEYPAYIDAWKKFQGQANNIKVYEVKDAAQLIDVYYKVTKDIGAQPYGPPPVQLTAGQSQEFYVSRFARCVVVTVVHPDKDHRGQVEITDMTGQLLKPGEPGVDIFNQFYNGPDNPVEVYSACGPRLQGQIGGKWRIKAVNAAFSFFVDARGAYQFDWLAPKSTLSPLGDLILDPVRPDDNLNLQFRFVTSGQGQVIPDPQRIVGEIVAPDGKTAPIPTGLSPDNQGVYTLPFRPDVYSSQEGAFQISLQSEDQDQPAGDPAAVIAVQKVLVKSDSKAAPITPTPAITPTVIATLTPIPTPIPALRSAVPAALACPNPNNPKCSPQNPLLLILLAIIGLLVIGYILLRILRKPPEGFYVLYEGGERKGDVKPVKRSAARKLWGWWEARVGPGGDIKTGKPSAATQTPAAALFGNNNQPSDRPKVKVAGLSDDALSASSKKGKEQAPAKRKESVKPKQQPILGRFINEGGTTRFRSTQTTTVTLSKESMQIINLGNIEMKVSLDHSKLS